MSEAEDVESIGAIFRASIVEATNLSCKIVEVRPGEDVSLSCSKMSKQSSLFFWYKLVNTTKFSCISLMYGVHSKPEYCDGFKDGLFEMSFNISTVFLTIKKVEISDSGHYFCGFYGNGVISLSVVQLHVKGFHEPDDITSDCQKKLDVETKLLGGILAGLTVFFMTIIVGLVLQNKKLQKDAEEKPNPDRKKTLNPADLMFLSETIRRRRTAEERAVETHVIYTAST
ncbi:uncharacterized protein LOC121639313 [Melanotaenia boesemani]|uniref:uncharacterized protein LOC121639313 n=1 Tax=Melanotaenia boesemani TaxID=1250792 RepID=UPI001C051E72|nr:uncharacterized protein LOC121639313 [Melanotaenia boesemani]